jgi:hypothetical protein
LAVVIGRRLLPANSVVHAGPQKYKLGGIGKRQSLRTRIKRLIPGVA